MKIFIHYWLTGISTLANWNNNHLLSLTEILPAQCACMVEKLHAQMKSACTGAWCTWVNRTLVPVGEYPGMGWIFIPKHDEGSIHVSTYMATCRSTGTLSYGQWGTAVIALSQWFIAWDRWAWAWWSWMIRQLTETKDRNWQWQLKEMSDSEISPETETERKHKLYILATDKTHTVLCLESNRSNTLSRPPGTAIWGYSYCV